MFKRLGGGVKGFLTMLKNCTFLAGWLPLSNRIHIFIRLIIVFVCCVICLIVLILFIISLIFTSPNALAGKLGFPFFVLRGLLSCIVRLQTRVTPSCSLQTGKKPKLPKVWALTSKIQGYRSVRDDGGLYQVVVRGKIQDASGTGASPGFQIAPRSYCGSWSPHQSFWWVSAEWNKRWNQCWERLRLSCWTDNRRWTRLRPSGEMMMAVMVMMMVMVRMMVMMLVRMGRSMVVTTWGEQDCGSQVTAICLWCQNLNWKDDSFWPKSTAA